ncbi:N-acyl homoserine lactonase family protein [Microbacterium halotolerans]|uniref:N-acyl homoserine lactonase family protein n=1 Tax=Microbacterium halotolerans TaxID=246613 RepID=UPI000E6ABC5D|nr:N-acyl homoserine lactonase family protein [Microbacterium halotolerans]
MTRVDAWTGAAPLAVRGRPRRLVPMVLGFEPIREDVSIRGGSAFRHLMEPVTAAAVVYDEGWILLDGGFDPDRVRDPVRRAASFDYEGYTPIVPQGDPLVDQVAEAGLQWGDLAGAAISHAHFDHTGAARLLDDDQPLLLQRREWQHVCEAPSERAAFLFRADFDHPRLRIGLLDGDTSLAPGVDAIDTAGHTPGHQSFVVRLAGESIVLAGDAADLRANIDQRAPTGSVADPVDDAAAQRAVDRLTALDARADTVVWPSHDPEWEPWQRTIRRR